MASRAIGLHKKEIPMSRKTARNRNHVVNQDHISRMEENRNLRIGAGFANRHDERAHAKESVKAMVVHRRGFRPIFPFPTI